MHYFFSVTTMRCTLFLTLLASIGCSNVQQLQPTLDAIEAVQGILSEADANPVEANPANVVNTTTETEPALIEQDIWQYIASKLEFTHDKNKPAVQAEIRRFQKHPRTIIHFANNARPFIYYIVNEIEKYNLPMDLALLPAIESAFDPLAYSSGHAAGMWQFIQSTGEIYNLKQSWWRDDRRDVVASTGAAISYLSDLNIMFKKDWLLSLAAYNAGPGRISSEMRKSKKRGHKQDFWSINTPKQTARYVPKLIALAAIIESPKAYGFDLPSVPNQPYFDIVDAQSQVNLNKIANDLGLSTQQVYNLNPAYNRDFTPPNGPHQILLPTAYISQLNAILATNSHGKYTGEATHIVSAGENLSAIARQYGSSITQLCSLNKLNRRAVLKIGQKLLVKEGHNMGHSANTDRSAYKRKVVYQVRSGDSLYAIAAKFNVSVNQLKSWNTAKLNNKNYLYPGDNIRVYVDVTQIF